MVAGPTFQSMTVPFIEGAVTATMAHISALGQFDTLRTPLNILGQSLHRPDVFLKDDNAVNLAFVALGTKRSLERGNVAQANVLLTRAAPMFQGEISGQGRLLHKLCHPREGGDPVHSAIDSLSHLLSNGGIKEIEEQVDRFMAGVLKMTDPNRAEEVRRFSITTGSRPGQVPIIWVRARDTKTGQETRVPVSLSVRYPGGREDYYRLRNSFIEKYQHWYRRALLEFAPQWFRDIGENVDVRHEGLTIEEFLRKGRPETEEKIFSY